MEKLNSKAIFNEAHTHRYSLLRSWDTEKGPVLFIMLNPSTANGETDDPTIRRCVNFAKSWGFGSLQVVNLFSLVSPDPKLLLTAKDSIGINNDQFILSAAEDSDKIIVAWGAFPEARERAKEVLKMLNMYNIYCLGITQGGHPKHPLYLRRYLEPIIYATKETPEEAKPWQYM